MPNNSQRVTQPFAAGILACGYLIATATSPANADEIEKRINDKKPAEPDIEAATETVTAWPTYLRDNARTGITNEEIQLPLDQAWTYQARHAPQPAWPPPANQDFWHNQFGLPARVTYDRAFHTVSDGKRVYFGSSANDSVYCLDLQNGRELWQFFTEGPVRLAPTLHDGQVFFGSDDGVVYCVTADDGQLIWKHRPVEPDLRVPGNSRMISVWPIRSGVIIENGQARCAAGLFPAQGTYQLVLDAKSGKQLAKSDLSFSPQGYMQRVGNTLTIAQGRAPQTFLSKLERSGTTTEPQLGTAPKDFPFALIGAKELRFAGGDGSVAAFSAKDGEQLWSAKVEGRAYSLAIASGYLLVSTDAGRIYGFRNHGQPEYEGEPLQPIEATVQYETLAEAYRSYVDALLRHTDVRQGYCLVLGSDHSALLPHFLAERTKMKIVVAERDEKKIRNQQRSLSIGDPKLDDRISVHHVGSDRLPYGSALFNLIVAEESPADGSMPVSASEVRRLLRPGGGVALFSVPAKEPASLAALEAWSKDLDPAERQVINDDVAWLKITRRPLDNVGEWTHMYGDTANTACSGDQRVSGSLSLQWFGPPGPQPMLDRHHRTVPPLYAAGRLFVPGDNQYFAVDAYNGTVLWNAELPGSRRVGVMRDAGSMAASEDVLYIAAQGQCVGLNTATGQRQLVFDVPSGASGEARHWGYVARVGDRLFGSATKPGASRSGHSREQINETYFDHVPVVTSDGLFCLGRIDGALGWRYDCQLGAVLNSTITIGNGRIYFVESRNRETLIEKTGRSKLAALLGPGADLVALDVGTGKQIWRGEIDVKQIQHHLYLCYAKEKLILAGSKNKQDDNRAYVWYDVHGFDAATGKHLWSQTQNQKQGVGGDHGEQDHHPVIVGDVVYQEPYAYDLTSGQLKDDWKFARGGHGCGTISASASAFFFRATNPAMCDLATGQNSKITHVSRPGCWINMIPAGGLLLIPEASSGCSCNFAIQSSMAFMPTQLTD